MKMAKKNERAILIEGVFFTLRECRERHENALRIWKEDVAWLRRSRDGYINILTSREVFQTGRRIYKYKHRPIPTLRVHKDARVKTVEDKRENAEEFERKFLENTFPSEYSKEDSQYVDECTRRCNS